MCKTCSCENEPKCSVKGYEPEGWCCDHCDSHPIIEDCESRFEKKQDGSPIMGLCLGCKRKEIQLNWILPKIKKGFCIDCFLKFNKKELLNILLDNWEGV